MSRIVSFPFTYIGKTKLGQVHRPYAIVSAFSKIRNRWQPLEMVIDTGADYTLLPKRYAFLLGIDFRHDCLTEKTLGVGGTEKVYQYNKLPIKISSWQNEIPVGFLDRDDLPPLLGRLGCLELLRLVFDKKTSLFETT